jgi:hypothetical protein
MGQQRLEFLAAAAVLAICAISSAAMAADGLDRYGGRARAPISSYGVQPGDRMLNWPGKVEIAAPTQPVAPAQAYSAAAYGPTTPYVPAGSPGPSVVPTHGAQPSSGSAPRPVTMAGLAPVASTAGTFPPPPQAAVQTQIATQSLPPAPDRGGESHVRLYSLHRDYGLEPDAVPLPPSAFTVTADLAGQDQSAATPQPSPKTPQGRTAITAARIADGEDVQP